MANSTPNNPLHNRHCKDNEMQFRKTQMRTIFRYLQTHVATASMITAATGIAQKNICRYKRDLEKSGLLWEIEKRPCKHTGHRAWYLTTDPSKAPRQNQLSMFPIDSRETKRTA